MRPYTLFQAAVVTRLYGAGPLAKRMDEARAAMEKLRLRRKLARPSQRQTPPVSPCARGDADHARLQNAPLQTAPLLTHQTIYYSALIQSALL